MGAIVKDLITSDLSKKDETIRAFIDRRFGSFIASNVFDPLTLGIYGGDINKLSVVSCFSHLKKLELEHASIIKGFIKSLRSKKANKSKGLFTLKNGMESLVKQLVDKGKGDIYLNSKIQFLPDGYDHYILALPSKEMTERYKIFLFN